MTVPVVVVGGGSAGLAAAVGAAREGADVLLVERQGMLGGMGSLALVHTFCGLFHPDTTRPWQWLNQGVAREMGERMMDATGQAGPTLMGRVYVLPQAPSMFQVLADKLCREEARLTTWTGVEVIGCRRSGDAWELDVANHGEIRTVSAGALVDCSGDALIGRLLGGGHVVQADASRLFRPAFIFGIPGCREPWSEALRLRLAGAIVRKVKEGGLPAEALGASIREAPLGGEAYVTIDLAAGGADWDPLDPDARVAAERTGRRVAMELWTFLRNDFSEIGIEAPPVFPAQCGVRESARWQGEAVMTAAELLASKRHDDEVALAGWPMEMRETANGAKWRYPERPEPAGIRAGCLRQPALPGVYFAGRCLSSDHEALSSLRVMGTCLATGEAAGRMAARFVG